MFLTVASKHSTTEFTVFFDVVRADQGHDPTTGRLEPRTATGRRAGPRTGVENEEFFRMYGLRHCCFFCTRNLYPAASPFPLLGPAKRATSSESQTDVAQFFG